MENIVCFSVLVDNNEGPSIQLGMRTLPLYCRNSFSDGVWPFVVARAPRHMTRVVLDVPMKRKYPGQHFEGGGSGRSSLCTKFPGRLHSSPKTSIYGVKPVVLCTVVL